MMMREWHACHTVERVLAMPAGGGLHLILLCTRAICPETDASQQQHRCTSPLQQICLLSSHERWPGCETKAYDTWSLQCSQARHLHSCKIRNGAEDHAD